MALYWPDQKVALEIIDDPLAEPIDQEMCKGWSVLRVTCKQMDDLDQFRDVQDQLADLLGSPRVKRTPKWLAANKRLWDELNSCTTDF